MFSFFGIDTHSKTVQNCTAIVSCHNTRVERKAHLDPNTKESTIVKKQLFVSKMCLGLCLIVCWSTPTRTGDEIPTHIKHQLTINAAKKWNNYTDKLVETCLKVNVYFPLTDAKDSIVKLMKTFLIFAKSHLTLYAPHQTAFSFYIVGRKGELCEKIIKVPSGTICHKQYNWNVNYTFHFEWAFTFKFVNM